MKLAINGGTPVRTEPFPAYVTIGEEEKRALCEVVDSGVLSKYLGCWHDQFMGGVRVRELERRWAEYFGARHAIAVNSCTSGLYCAVGATGVEPGEEIIVPPYTMSATATAPLVYNAVPVFADIEEDCFCLDPRSVEERITPRTRAIMAVDLFGQPYDADALRTLADKHGLVLIEDAAQAPGASYKGRYAGTLSDMGVFSLNYHKHIHSGEGGVIVTDDDELAEKCRLIRNHAEAVVEGKGVADLANMIGFNYRMTELEAAVSLCQLDKLAVLNEKRLENVAYLEAGLKDIPAITLPVVRPGAAHAYYVHACRFDAEAAGVGRDAFVAAVRAELPHHRLRESEGVKLGAGYVKPLYLQPLFQQRIAYGSKGYPFTGADVDYSRGICPVCERMHFEELFSHEFMLPSMGKKDMDDVLKAFAKVWEHRAELEG